MQCREGLTQIQRQSISQKEYQIVKALFQKLPHQLRDHLHLKSSIKPLSKSNVILTGDDSETESHYFSILFFKLLPRKLLLILIISFWGWACDIAGDKKIKRSLVAQFRRSWKSVKLERVSYLQLSYIGNSWLKGEAQVFFTSSSHCWLLTHPYWHWRPSKKFPFRFYLFFKMTWVGKWERSSQGGIVKRIENQFENPF